MKLFFILYDGRSGSTFLSKLLAEKANILIPHESNFISTILSLKSKGRASIDEDELEVIIDTILNEEKFKDWDFDKNELLELFGKYEFPVDIKTVISYILERHAEKLGGKFDAIGIKKGSYLKNYNELIDLFPDAKFICLIRDGRAVYNSKKKAYIISNKTAFLNNPIYAARKWSKILK